MEEGYINISVDLELKALWSDLVDKKLGDCTTAVVKDDAQNVTEKVVMTTFGLEMKTSQPDMPNYL